MRENLATVFATMAALVALLVLVWCACVNVQAGPVLAGGDLFLNMLSMFAVIATLFTSTLTVLCDLSARRAVRAFDRNWRMSQPF